MIIIYYPNSKNTHNLRFMNCKNFRDSNYVLKFQKSITTCKWSVEYMTYKTKI